MSTIEVDVVLDWKNIVYVYEFFCRHSLSNGIEKCYQFIDANSTKLIADKNIFASLPLELVKIILLRDTFQAKEIDIFNAVICWHKKHEDYNLQELLNLLRWNLIDADDYLDHVKPLNIVSYDQYFEYMSNEKPERRYVGTQSIKLAGNGSKYENKSLLAGETSHYESPSAPTSIRKIGDNSTEKKRETNRNDVRLENASSAVDHELSPLDDSNFYFRTLFNEADECEFLNQTSSNSLREDWIFDVESMNYHCNHCDFITQSISIIQRHECTEAEKQFHCFKCNLSFTQKCQLDDHLKAHQVHFKCGDCGKSKFTLFSSITKHKERGSCAKRQMRKSKK